MDGNVREFLIFETLLQLHHHNYPREKGNLPVRLLPAHALLRSTLNQQASASSHRNSTTVPTIVRVPHPGSAAENDLCMSPEVTSKNAHTYVPLAWLHHRVSSTVFDALNRRLSIAIDSLPTEISIKIYEVGLPDVLVRVARGIVNQHHDTSTRTSSVFSHFSFHIEKRSCQNERK